jgi:hypothetical protein
MDAESCWRDCCCMSLGEKLAWARQVGVQPPAFVVAAAAREIIAAKTSQVATSGCCSAKAKSCCASSTACCSSKVAAAPMGRQRGVKTVSFLAAMKCRGLTASVALLPPSLPLLAAEFLPPIVERYDVRIGDSPPCENPYLAIPTPPPQGALA